MKTANIIKPAISVVAVVSLIGLAYAQTGTGTPSQPNTATPPEVNTNTAPMNNPSGSDMNRAPTPSSNSSTTGNLPGQPADTAATPAPERVARADRG